MILVTGATGRVGQEVVAALTGQGHHVHAASRGPARQASEPRVTWHRGDIRDPESLRPALEQVDAVFLFPVFGGCDGFVRLAFDAGVERIVLLSSAAVTDPEPNPIGRAHRQIEEAIEASGLEWTFVRPTVFMANDLAWVPAIRGRRPVELAHPDAAMSPIAEHDVAAVAAHALTHDLGGRALEITGPEPLTQGQRLREIGEALGREISWREIPERTAAQRLSAEMPQEAVDYLLGNLRRAQERPSRPTPDLPDLLGRHARTYAQWLEETRVFAPSDVPRADGRPRA